MRLMQPDPGSPPPPYGAAPSAPPGLSRPSERICPLLCLLSATAGQCKFLDSCQGTGGRTQLLRRDQPKIWSTSPGLYIAWPAPSNGRRD